MGWSVGFDRERNRFRGYGVPAYCDVADCGAEIDRGFGYLCGGAFCERDYTDDEEARGCLDLDELEKPAIFVCGKHTCKDVDESNLPSEHPDWLEHILHDPSWTRWRDENPQRVLELGGTL